MRKYVLGIVLTLLIALGGVFNSDTKALDSDYKNNLLKVDVTKGAGDTYKIELFTQKPYSEPIKVRKKSDTSYYILLPETNHSITSVGSSGDINKVDVKLYPYAGQDLNNGYTKINIQTNKPITFTTNVKTATRQAPSLDAKKLAQLDKAFEQKPSYNPQEKTVQAQKTVKPVTKPVAKPVSASVKPAVPASKPVVKAPVAPQEVKEPVKVAANEKTQTKTLLAQQQPEIQKQPVRKPVEKTVEKAVEENPVETFAKQEPQRVSHATNSEIEIVTKPSKQKEEQKPVKIAEQQKPASLEEVVNDDIQGEDKIEQDAKEQGLIEAEETVAEETTEVVETVPVRKQSRVRRVLSAAKRIALENIFVPIAFLLFIISILLLVLPAGKKPKKTAKDALIQENPEISKEPAFVEEQVFTPEEQLQSFAAAEPVVDKTQEASTQEAPAHERPSYTEYESYEANIEPAAPIEPAIYAVPDIEEAPVVQPEPVEEIEQEAEDVAEEDEATVLASESFGDGRGLCLVNYGGDIALVGFIGEEIFVIQNFGKITLISPNIQVRVAEQNDNDTVYIVKTANSKLMVKETKTFIGLEMVM